jgi:hypothetical protein
MLKLNKRKKSPRKGLGKSIENLCIKFEQVKAAKGRDYGSDPTKRRKKRAAKRSSKRRDPAVKRRTIRRPFIRSAVGPWRGGGDPSWFGHPRLHKKAAKKGVRRAKRKTVKRDPAWFGHPRLHAKAAKKGARRAKRRAAPRRDPSWFGHPRAHSKAAKKGARRSKARKGGAKKRRSPAQIAATKRMLAGLKASQGRSPGGRRKSPTRRRASTRGGMSYRDAMRGL